MVRRQAIEIGIDCKDHYHLKNIQLVCYAVNMMKWTQEQEEMLQWCIRINNYYDNKKQTTKTKKARIVEHFLTKNATEAAKRCGYSEKSSYNQGYRLMNDDEVQEMLAKELAESKERNLKDHDSIIERLKQEALGDTMGIQQEAV